jgi:6-phosphogluconolactonase
MGPDGHCASLFPGTAALEEETRWVVGNWVPQQDTWRMTLTFPILVAGRDVLFVVTGADKADPIRAIRAGGSGLPAERVSGEQVEWIVDEAAAGNA